MTDYTVSTRRSRRRGRIRVLAAVGILLTSGAYVVTRAVPAFAATSANVWLTTADASEKLAQQASVAFGTPGSGSVITVNPNITYQSIIGFGGSMTDASAFNIWNSPSRSSIMNNLFGSSGISLSFLRQPIGAADFSTSFYSLDDGSADPSLSHFNITHDQSYLIPLLQQAKSLNPQLTFMATPWSAPGWMKTSGSMVGGSLISGDESVLAQYLTKFVQSFGSQGIPISYLTVANEPQFSPAGYPGMLMSASQEISVINDLAPDLSSAGVGSTKILVWDHNWDNTSYPEQVLAGTGNNNVGVAWYHYGGTASSMSTVHNAYPAKQELETEGSWTSGTNWAQEILGQGGTTAIDSLRNWAQAVTFWNLALNASGGPVTGNSCACTAPVTTNGSSVTYNAEYYILGQFSKFIPPGAVHIDSNVAGSIDDVAFKNPDGSIALVALNNGSSAQSFQVSYGGSSFGYSLPGGAIATFTWPGTISGGGTTGQITGYQGLCLDDRSASTTNFNPIQVYTCNGTNAQQWTVASGSTLRVLGKCLDVAGAGTANGTLVDLYDCNGTVAQVWQPQSNGSLLNPNSGKCLDDTGFGGSGTQVQIWDCTGNANQHWNLP